MPKQVSIDFGPPSPVSEFEEITSHYSHQHQHQHQPAPAPEELPLHYMQSDGGEVRYRHKPVGPSGLDNDYRNGRGYGYADEDDGGKEVYAKMRTSNALRNIPRPPPTSFQEDLMEHLPAAVYTLLSCWTRFHAIGKSSHVIWDEAHFGKFGSYYLKVCTTWSSVTCH